MQEQTLIKKLPRRANVYQQGKLAGRFLEEPDEGWRFVYDLGYDGDPISLTLPYREEPYIFSEFPSVFEGLLPEGPQLEGLLRKCKIDRDDYFKQLVTVGGDLVGSLTVMESTVKP